MLSNFRKYVYPYNSVNFDYCIYVQGLDILYMVEKIIPASLDRIEGDFAVVYADDDGGDDDRGAPHKFDVPVELVNGAKPGVRLQLHIENNQIKRIEIDREVTEEARDRIRKKYEMLRRGSHLK
jgi:hypothetical protein